MGARCFLVRKFGAIAAKMRRLLPFLASPLGDRIRRLRTCVEGHSNLRAIPGGPKGRCVALQPTYRMFIVNQRYIKRDLAG